MYSYVTNNIFSIFKLYNIASLAETRTKLPKATRMSDFSSTDDEVRKIKKKSLSISPDMFKTKKDHLANTCPQPKKYCDFIKEGNDDIIL